MTPVGQTAVEKLLHISSEPLSEPVAVIPQLLSSYSLGQELFDLLRERNGFYAFESALHVFPLSSASCMSLEEWNSKSLWRVGYGELDEGLLFFAEDAFQDQFCLHKDGVLRFRAETGNTMFVANSIENWAKALLANYIQETGWELAKEWQAKNGPLPAGKRLMPETPFFLGGRYSLDNLWAGDAVEGMRLKADLANQTKALPDGSQVRLVVAKKPHIQ